MSLKILSLIIIVLAVVLIAACGFILRLRKPLSARLSSMGGIFDFGAKVRGVYPPFVEGMCGAYYMRFRFVPGKRFKGIVSAKIEIPVDSQVVWTFTPDDIENGDPQAFGASLDSFKALANMEGFEAVHMEKELLTAVFSAEKAGGELELQNVPAMRRRVVAMGKLARKLGCMAKL
ncbi:hypothetical protein SAMN02745216_02631 [Desulfatibacillum alkenivorans DSM 16219]|jgi:hypothetical protein|uniref:Uncharacterized protein n=1 Tax=Desulfatibacillum alkenivorans DSM 16219 TaxID=1121393 RepID=A0A1M6NMB6_9BACT|nr:hypothetical protein [Desulfatibacillum alkenivorans]SHJ96825.1 hypothetical protein SAMN02745216_02631 [Desulfatibacillum alkenivorans DSM 16219]